MNKQKTKSLATKLSLAMGGVILVTCILLVGTCSWVFSSVKTTMKEITYDSPYGELPDPGCAGWAFKEWNTKADGSGSTITKDDICKGDISVYALWSYKPVNVSVPQTLIGDKNGNSEFVVKSDDIESGSIDVTIPDGFYYNQKGKSPVYASISTDGDSKLTKDNTAIKYSIITDGLTAGCWSGSFNINLKLNK